jgi:hypothetical protein
MESCTPSAWASRAAARTAARRSGSRLSTVGRPPSNGTLGSPIAEGLSADLTWVRLAGSSSEPPRLSIVMAKPSSATTSTVAARVPPGRREVRGLVR